jgi:hypothetical protein
MRFPLESQDETPDYLGLLALSGQSATQSQLVSQPQVPVGSLGAETPLAQQLALLSPRLLSPSPASKQGVNELGIAKVKALASSPASKQGVNDLLEVHTEPMSQTETQCTQPPPVDLLNCSLTLDASDAEVENDERLLLQNSPLALAVHKPLNLPGTQSQRSHANKSRSLSASRDQQQLLLQQHVLVAPRPQSTGQERVRTYSTCCHQIAFLSLQPIRLPVRILLAAIKLPFCLFNQSVCQYVFYLLPSKCLSVC